MRKKRKRQQCAVPLFLRLKIAVVLVIILAKLMGYNIKLVKISEQPFIQKQAISLAIDGVKHRIAKIIGG